jgi:O-antigen biosynthesis protein
MYHQVSSIPLPPYARYTVTPTAFARQMRVLATLGYRSISLDRLLAARAAGTDLPKRSVVITFDDGFADALRHAVPVLARHRLTATFFVVAGLLGKSSEWTRRKRGLEMPLADADTLRALLADGFTIGSHTLTHRHLTELPDSECRYELSESKRRLEDALRREVHHLAYPYGSTNDGVRQNAADCGYRTACATTEGIATAWDDLLMLPRLLVSGSDSLADFVCRLRTGHELKALAHRVRVSMNVSALSR